MEKPTCFFLEKIKRRIVRCPHAFMFWLFAFLFVVLDSSLTSFDAREYFMLSLSNKNATLTDNNFEGKYFQIIELRYLW